ncbi:unnamed protein product [Thelazia callipaeda]|uniref:DM domain-containing protein n=1 Tax=Thelazia callipaeda TaxID=103827 RepID=A0A0N5CQS4_THECL|nr:unnamed protein product [Thelazia callipaeda]
MDIVASVIAPSAASVNSTTAPQILAFKGQAENVLRGMDPSDDLPLMCTKKCIPCHRCGSSMKFFMRRVKYLNTVKEYPAYRCMKKKCQTFRSPRTLARECNMLLRQGFGDGRLMSVTPTTNATRQLKEAFPDHFNKQEIDNLQRFPINFKDDYDAFPYDQTLLAHTTNSSAVREREAWYALKNAKRSLDLLAQAGDGLSLRLFRVIGDIHSMAVHFREFVNRDEPINGILSCSDRVMETSVMHEAEEESYDRSFSMKRSSETNDFASQAQGGDSRSSFDTELKSDTSSVDTSISMKMPSSASVLSPNITQVQPLRWINISRHSPSFSVKMVDSNEKVYSTCSVTRRTADQEKHTVAEQAGTAVYESYSNGTNGNNTHETAMSTNHIAKQSASISNVMYDEASTSYNYTVAPDISITESNIQGNTNGNNVESRKNEEPVSIYVRPSELCFDDVADGGEILSEFFMPSPSNFHVTKCDTNCDINTTVYDLAMFEYATNSIVFAALEF